MDVVVVFFDIFPSQRRSLRLRAVNLGAMGSRPFTDNVE
jgi:hypothetical protein